MRRRSQHTLFLMVLMLHSMCLKCELPFAWSKYIENQVEEISEDRLESLLTEIESLLERPVPIHDVEKQQLERLFFLNHRQIEGLAYYVYRYGPLVDARELILADGMDGETLELLLPCIRLNESSKEKPLSNLKSKHLLQVGISGKSGDWNETTAWKQHAKYEYQRSDRLMGGWVVEKDPGETWIKQRNRLQYTSVHLALTFDKGAGKVWMGDYKMSFGQGLLMGNAYQLGKMGFTLATDSKVTQLRRHFSTAESGFFRGLATSWSKSNKTLFFQTGGGLSNHLQNEIRTRMAFAFVRIQGLRWEQSLCLVSGKESFSHAGASYAFRLHVLHARLFGEASLDKNGKTAIQIHAQPVLPDPIQLGLSVRSYDIHYEAPLANAMMEGSNVKNERGCMMQIQWQPTANWTLKAYHDVFLFPWIGYRRNSLASGFDQGIQLQYQNGYNPTVLIQMKQKCKPGNTTYEVQPEHTIEEKTKQSLRIQTQVQTGSMTWTCQSNFNRAVSDRSGRSSLGKQLSMHVSYRSAAAVSAQFRFALFQTDSYDNRFYVYEPGLKGDFTMPMLYGNGHTWMWMLQHICNKRWSYQCKIQRNSTQAGFRMGIHIQYKK